MNLHTLSSAVSFDEISEWEPFEQTLHLRVTTQSEFTLYSEPAAISKLHELAERGILIAVSTTFSIENAGPGPAAASNLHILYSLFGLSLVSLAATVRGPAGTDERLRLLDELWRAVVQGTGRIGDGKRQYIISRDPDSPVPSCLRGQDHLAFCELQKLQTVLRTVVSDLTSGRAPMSASKTPSPLFGSSKVEGSLLKYVYEAALNAHEHTAINSAVETRSGVRGITVEKHIFSSSAPYAARQQLPSFIKGYLSGLEQSSDEFTLVTFSVSDLGPGIHRTLPPLDGEDAWSRLLRAFKSGESRKPTGIEVARGEGFAQILASLHALRAFLFVRSAELIGWRDGNLRDSLDAPVLTRQDHSTSSAVGTSLSLSWVLPTTSPDQKLLF